MLGMNRRNTPRGQMSMGKGGPAIQMMEGREWDDIDFVCLFVFVSCFCSYPFVYLSCPALWCWYVRPRWYNMLLSQAMGGKGQGRGLNIVRLSRKIYGAPSVCLTVAGPIAPDLVVGLAHCMPRDEFQH